MKILFKLAITRRAVFSSKCTKNRAPQSPDPLAGFNGPTSKEGDGRAGRYGEGREGWGDEWRGKGEQGRGGARACPPLLNIISGYAADHIITKYNQYKKLSAYKITNTSLILVIFAKIISNKK